MNSTQQGRRTQAIGLTLFAAITIAALGWTLGVTALILAALALPVPLVLLWLSADVLRADEAREAVGAVGAAHRPRRDAATATEAARATA